MGKNDIHKQVNEFLKELDRDRTLEARFGDAKLKVEKEYLDYFADVQVPVGAIAAGGFIAYMCGELMKVAFPLRYPWLRWLDRLMSRCPIKLLSALWESWAENHRVWGKNMAELVLAGFIAVKGSDILGAEAAQTAAGILCNGAERDLKKFIERLNKL